MLPHPSLPAVVAVSLPAAAATVPKADLLTQRAPCHSPAVAIGLEEGAFPLSNGNKLDDPYPPSVLVHFTADKNTDVVSCCAGCEGC